MDKKRDFIGAPKIDISDKDLIENPAGFRHPEETIVKELQRLTEEVKGIKNKVSGRDVGPVETIENVKKPNIKAASNRDLRRKLRGFKSTARLGRKETELLTILSDFKPHRTKGLTHEVPTKAYKKLKEALKGKMGGSGLCIKTIKGTGFNPDSFYQLVYLPSAES